MSSTWIKHLYQLIDGLNDSETQMTGISQKTVTELEKVPLGERVIPPEDTLVKNTTTSAREPQIEYGLRRHTD